MNTSGFGSRGFVCVVELSGTLLLTHAMCAVCEVLKTTARSAMEEVFSISRSVNYSFLRDITRKNRNGHASHFVFREDYAVALD